MNLPDKKHLWYQSLLQYTKGIYLFVRFLYSKYLSPCTESRKSSSRGPGLQGKACRCKSVNNVMDDFSRCL